MITNFAQTYLLTYYGFLFAPYTIWHISDRLAATRHLLLCDMSEKG